MIATATYPKYMKIDAVCKHLDVSDTTVYTLAKKGLLKLVHLPSANAKPVDQRSSNAPVKRKGIPRILGESLALYESGRVSISSPPGQQDPPARPAKRPPSPASVVSKIRHFR